MWLGQPHTLSFDCQYPQGCPHEIDQKRQLHWRCCGSLDPNSTNCETAEDSLRRLEKERTAFIKDLASKTPTVEEWTKQLADLRKLVATPDFLRFVNSERDAKLIAFAIVVMLIQAQIH